MASCPCGKGSHHPLDDSRAGIVERVGGLASLEEYIGVLGCAPEHGPVGSKGALPVGVDCLLGDEAAQVLVAELFDFRQLVRRAEAVEEVKERHPRVQGGRMRNSRKIMGLLHRV